MSLTERERLKQTQVANALADQWIAERGGYVAFDAVFVNGERVPRPANQQKTFTDALTSLMTRFEQGADAAKREGSRYLSSTQYRQNLADNEAFRRSDELRPAPSTTQPGLVAPPLGYEIRYLTGADIAAFEEGFRAAATYLELPVRSPEPPATSTIGDQLESLALAAAPLGLALYLTRDKWSFPWKRR